MEGVSATGDVVQQTFWRQLIISPWVVLGPLLIGLIIAAVVLGVRWWRNKPGVMTGEFNIAVAEFEPVPAWDKSGMAENVSQILFNMLDSEYKLASFGTKVQVAHEHIGVIHSGDSAAKMARRIRADVIIFGTVSMLGSDILITPKFYVSDDLLPNVSVLIGPHSLAPPFLIDPTDLPGPDGRLQHNTVIIIEFSKALSYIASNQWDMARTSLQKALSAAGETTFPGKEVLYLFAAATETSLNNFAAARQYVNRALEANPQYGRAYIALGNTYYRQGTEHLEQGNKVLAQEEYASALGNYQRAALPEYQQPDAFVLEKSHLSTGNVYTAEYLYLGNSEAEKQSYARQALQHYQAVIDSYNANPDSRLRQVVALAYYGAGLIYQNRADTETARDMFQSAVELFTDQNLKATTEAYLNNDQSRN